MSYKVNTAFFDLEGLVVYPERIERVVLRSSHGTERILEAPDVGTHETGAIWLQSGRVVRRFHGLEETPILWSLDAIEIDGTNVVNRAQQRFFVHENDVWDIELLLYEARFTARDALFGFPLGAGVNLEYPNGMVDVVEFGPDAAVEVQSLPRGEYRVNVADAPGYSPYSPVALSRNQQVDLLVISYIDMGVAAVLLGVLAIGLLFVGRPSIARHLRVPARAGRLRRAFLVISSTALITGVLILTFGLGKDPAASIDQTAVSSQATLSPSMAVLPLFTTGDPDDAAYTTIPTPPEIIVDDEQNELEHRKHEILVAGVFKEIWDNNNGLAVIGRPISRPIKQSTDDPEITRVIQHFENATLVYDGGRPRGGPGVQLEDLGVEFAMKEGVLASQPFLAVASRPDTDDDCRYFNAAGHYICGVFLEYWNSRGINLGQQANSYQGSIALFGYPISEAFEDPKTGRTVQYFERVRLEKFPELADTPHVVQQSSLKGVQS